MEKNSEEKAKKILEKYIKEDFSKELTEVTRKWIASERHASLKKEFFREIWSELPSYYDLRTEKALKEVKIELGMSPMRQSFIHRKFFRISIAAAVAVIIGIAGWFLKFSAEDKIAEQELLVITLKTGEEEKKHVDLFAETEVWINNITEITYTDPQELDLNGEAFFDIRHLEGKSFSVKGISLKAVVTGTRFNFRSYNIEDESVISLYKGSLNVFTPDSVVTLKAGYELIYNKSYRTLTIRSIDRNQPDWMRNIINFENAGVTDIFRALENIYGITINAEDFEPGNDLIELKMEEGLDLEDVMFFLSSICGTFEYSINGNLVYVHTIKN